jgi:hypothetical protein
MASQISQVSPTARSSEQFECLNSGTPIYHPSGTALKRFTLGLVSKQYDAFVEDESNYRRHESEKNVTNERVSRRWFLDLQQHLKSWLSTRTPADYPTFDLRPGLTDDPNTRLVTSELTQRGARDAPTLTDAERVQTLLIYREKARRGLSTRSFKLRQWLSAAREMGWS